MGRRQKTHIPPSTLEDDFNITYSDTEKRQYEILKLSLISPPITLNDIVFEFNIESVIDKIKKANGTNYINIELDDNDIINAINKYKLKFPTYAEAYDLSNYKVEGNIITFKRKKSDICLICNQFDKYRPPHVNSDGSLIIIGDEKKVYFRCFRNEDAYKASKDKILADNFRWEKNKIVCILNPKEPEVKTHTLIGKKIRPI
jgi:hypothetical protein